MPGILTAGIGFNSGNPVSSGNTELVVYDAQNTITINSVIADSKSLGLARE